jgi:predicted phosphodiesterase
LWWAHSEKNTRGEYYDMNDKKDIYQGLAVTRSALLPLFVLASAAAMLLLLAGCAESSSPSSAGSSQSPTAGSEQLARTEEEALRETTPTPEPAETSTVTPKPTKTPRPTETPTATPSPTPQVARVAVIGDYGQAGEAEEAVADLVKSWQPDIIVTTGDNNYPGGSAETIDENIGQYYHEYIFPYKGSYGEGAKTNRFFPVLGNHDQGIEGSEAYLDYFTLPGNERYYTFTHKMIDFFMLNSLREPDGLTVDSIQGEWLREQLVASDACFKIVVCHHPPISSDLRGDYEWIDWPFQEWGADTLLSGHQHAYERIVREGFPYFVNGLGGGSRYAFREEVPEGSEVRFNADHGAMLIDATREEMTFQFVTRAGEVIDTYTIETTESACQ